MMKRNEIEDSGIDTLNQIGYPLHEAKMEGKKMSAEQGKDKLLTVQEVCELLEVSKNYIYWLTHKQKIPHIKMQGHLRFRRSAIDNWLMAQEVRSGSTQEREEMVR